MMSGNPFPHNAWLTYAEATARWGKPTSPKQVEYILTTPEALSAHPAVRALVAEAEARAAMAAYRKACVAVQIVISRNTPDDGGDADPCLIDQLEAVESLIKREAAAIRKTG